MLKYVRGRLPRDGNPSLMTSAPREDYSPSGALRLIDVLRQLPERELTSLVHRLKISIDEAKRIDVASQVARALLTLPEVRDPAQLPGPTRELRASAHLDRRHRRCRRRALLRFHRAPGPIREPHSTRKRLLATRDFVSGREWRRRA